MGNIHSIHTKREKRREREKKSARACTQARAIEVEGDREKGSERER